MKHRCFAFTPGVPPAEARLWKAGDNPTDYGVHRWTERSAREVMARYEARGVPLQIDIEHNASDEVVAKLPPGSFPQVLGGYARLELRAGELWAIFDWSAAAVEQITTRQRLYLSPDYYVDKATDEITVLERISLVGSPGTHHAQVLASEGPTPPTQPDKLAGVVFDPNFALLLVLLRSANSVEDPAQAKRNVDELLTQVEKLANVPTPAPTPQQAAKAKAWNDPAAWSTVPADLRPRTGETRAAYNVRLQARVNAAEKSIAASTARPTPGPAPLNPSLQCLPNESLYLYHARQRALQESTDSTMVSPNITHAIRAAAARASMDRSEGEHLDRTFGKRPMGPSVQRLPDGRTTFSHLRSANAPTHEQVEAKIHAAAARMNRDDMNAIATGLRQIMAGPSWREGLYQLGEALGAA